MTVVWCGWTVRLDERQCMTGVNVAMMQRKWRSRYHLYRPTEQTCKQCKCHNYQKYPLPQCCDHKKSPSRFANAINFCARFQASHICSSIDSGGKREKKTCNF